MLTLFTKNHEMFTISFERQGKNSLQVTRFCSIERNVYTLKAVLRQKMFTLFRKKTVFQILQTFYNHILQNNIVQGGF